MRVKDPIDRHGMPGIAYVGKLIDATFDQTVEHNPALGGIVALVIEDHGSCPGYTVFK